MGPLRILSPDPGTGPWELSATVVPGPPHSPVLVSVRWGLGTGASFSRTCWVGHPAVGHEGLASVALAKELLAQALTVSAPLPRSSEVVRLLERARLEALREVVRRAARLARELPPDELLGAVGEAVAEEVMSS